ncbi:hypothetical protein PV325_001286 [Microctonus aethiopoides]|nr:hypothetical protein PV325_001286 [Microctonus aethiopoides]
MSPICSPEWCFRSIGGDGSGRGPDILGAQEGPIAWIRHDPDEIGSKIYCGLNLVEYPVSTEHFILKSTRSTTTKIQL